MSSCKKCVADPYPLHKASSAGHILCVQQFLNAGMLNYKLNIKFI